MKPVKFLKSYGKYKKGQVTELGFFLFTQLVTKGIVEVYKPELKASKKTTKNDESD